MFIVTTETKTLKKKLEEPIAITAAAEAVIYKLSMVAKTLKPTNRSSLSTE